MSILPTLRSGDVASQTYVDTPQFAYDNWLKYLNSENAAIGTVSPSATVAIIGAGVSGLCAAYELANAGCHVTVFEATDRIGGRTYSYSFKNASVPSNDIIELGAMRFPPSEFLLNWYLTSFGVTAPLNTLPDFPDPGVYNTYICYQNEKTVVWNAAVDPYPPGFQTVYQGWSALCSNGVTTNNGVPVLTSPAEISNFLQVNAITGLPANAAAAIEAWQQWLNAYGQESFYSGLYDIFTGASGNNIPGGVPWTHDDFTRFAALGLGSGGFGPMYPNSWSDIFRLVPDKLETTQRFIAGGIGSLANAFYNKLIVDLKDYATVNISTPVVSVAKVTVDIADIKKLLVTTASGEEHLFDKVIVATTTRSMEMSTDVTRYNKTKTPAVLSPETAESVKQTHVVSSNKIAARIGKFWATKPGAARTLLTDSAVHQVYTLDYGDKDTGVCFISYAWEDDAIKQQALGMSTGSGAVDKVALYKALLNKIRGLGGHVALWAENLIPYNGDYENNVQFIEWQQEPYYYSAFKVSQAGQDPYVQQMFFDFQKAGTSDDSGVFIASDDVSWIGGWVEGALQTGLNSATAVIKSLGGSVNTDQNNQSPLTMDAKTYDYFNT
jgi:tryptophan 2-monooxygenase